MAGKNGAPLRRRCPVCRSTRLHSIYEAARLPVFANVLWPDRDGAVRCPTADIRLVICHACGFIFNATFDPGLIEYGEHYENPLDYSDRFRRYARSLAERLIRRYDLHGREIIEIGCGKGDFLVMLCELGGNRGVGFDPSFEERSERGTRGDDVRFIKDHYGARYAHCSADVILSRQMLEHVPSPRRLLSAIRSAIGDRRTPLVVEVPNALRILRNCFVWDIIYEHYSYFTPVALSALCSLCGFEAKEISEEFDGQYLLVHAMPASGAAGARAACMEEVGDLAEEAAAFRERYRRLTDWWREEVGRLLEGGTRAVLWGAGSKGVTFANLLGLGERISAIVDVNPNKWGKYIAGAGMQVVSPRSLSAAPPDLIIVMNEIYETEIRGIVHEVGINPHLVHL
jgi:SAM-dependent methyltransferase